MRVVLAVMKLELFSGRAHKDVRTDDSRRSGARSGWLLQKARVEGWGGTVLKACLRASLYGVGDETCLCGQVMLEVLQGSIVDQKQCNDHRVMSCGW